MSYEETVRAKHAFQDSLKEFFRYASAMTLEEIEISMGRIADLYTSTNTEFEKFHYKVKGAALKLYFDLRNASKKRHGVLLRHKLRLEMREYFTSLGIEEYQKAQQEHQKKYKAYRTKVAGYEEKWEAWNAERKKIPLLKRIFRSDEIPGPPKYPVSEQISKYYPVPEKDYVKMSTDQATMDEFLINRVANFSLLSVPEAIQETQKQVYDVTPEDVKLLAP
jgi:hypothetical protein